MTEREKNGERLALQISRHRQAKHESLKDEDVKTAYIKGCEDTARAKWHDLRVNPDDLPELKKTKSGEIYNPLVLCFEYESDSRGKLAKVYALDRWEPDADRWQNNIYGSYTAWRELPEPPAESVEAAK